MANENSEQGKLFQKVVKLSDIRPQDKKNGQQQLFGTVEEFVPGFKEWAGLMTGRLTSSENRNEQLMERLEVTAARSDRLTASLESVLPKFLDQSINNTSPDLVFGSLAEGEMADVAIADGMTVPSETLYTLSTGEIAEKIGNDQMSAARMAMIIRDFGLFGDTRFHHTFSTSKQDSCQKYKPTIIEEIYKRLSNPSEHDLDNEKVAKAANFIRPKGAIGS